MSTGSAVGGPDRYSGPPTLGGAGPVHACARDCSLGTPRTPKARRESREGVARQLALEPRPFRAVGRTVRQQPVRGSVVNRCGGHWSAVADAPSAPGRRNSPHPIASPAQARQLRPWPSDVDRPYATPFAGVDPFHSRCPTAGGRTGTLNDDTGCGRASCPEDLARRARPRVRLGDQVALDLGEQREERGHDLRLDVALDPATPALARASRLTPATDRAARVCFKIPPNYARPPARRPRLVAEAGGS